VTGSNPYSYLFGPFVALLVVVGLVFLLRWAFSRGGSLVERTPHAGPSDQYGLLVAVASPPTDEDGEMLRVMLEQHGIRATLATTVDGPRLMVFQADERKARRLIAS
jgi:hypothetical protein